MRVFLGMNWALNAAGDHVRAGGPGANGYALRCPVCKASVYHRQGVIRRPHFAHFSGNSNQACELYDHGGSYSGAGPGAPPSFSGPSSVGPPALIWTDGELVPFSLQLRLPRISPGYASTLSVISSLGRRPFFSVDLARTSFVQLPLQEPPAKVETSPKDPAMEVWLESLLSQFRLSGNYFRTTVSGGILERADAALELGEEYFFVSQRRLLEPYPPALNLVREPRQHGSWWVYRLGLRDDPNTRDDDTVDLKFYLDRFIVPPRDKINVIWPSPSRYDSDGTPVFPETTNQLIVRSNVNRLNVEADARGTVTVNELGGGLHQINVNALEGEVVVWTAAGSIHRLRFQEVDYTTPGGVTLTTHGEAADLTAPSVMSIASQVGSIDVAVPVGLLWREARLNGKKLRPLPWDAVHSFEGPLQSLDFGAFGSVVVPQPPGGGGTNEVPWYEKVSSLVAVLIGPTAAVSLRSIRSKHDAMRWAIDSRAAHVLPLVLSAFSAGENRDIS